MELLTKALLASYQVGHRIAQCKKFHNIPEELTLPAATDLENTNIEGAAQQLKSCYRYLRPTCLIYHGLAFVGVSNFWFWGHSFGSRYAKANQGLERLG